ncbi:hypothetical protein INT43_003242 [Umbelopsis isabellina]|uniref:Homeobox domain-containing protein n=1 Tax=Mortierella isabellina TaxID=91625 RepID=A0A8H7PPG0_MORIS|nr:hypothetical protein INT43_003242 [Umbelopsis isabellina]
MTLPRLHTILNHSPSISRPRKPAVLDIANLLCPEENDQPTPISPYWESSSPTSSSARSRLSSPGQMHDDPWFAHRRHSREAGLDMASSSSLTTSKRPTAFKNPSERSFQSYSPSPPESYLNRSPSPYQSPSHSPRYSASIKAKRKRASAGQLDVLNRVFAQTFFPSTEMRNELAKQLGMSPRTVQIWFQNKRQSIRTKERDRSSVKGSKRDDGHFHHSLPTPPLSSNLDGANGYLDATP